MYRETFLVPNTLSSTATFPMFREVINREATASDFLWFSF